MPDEPDATPTPAPITEEEVFEAISDLNPDAQLAVEQILTMVWQRTDAAVKRVRSMGASWSDTSEVSTPVRWAACYAQGTADAIRHFRGES